MLRAKPKNLGKAKSTRMCPESPAIALILHIGEKRKVKRIYKLATVTLLMAVVFISFGIANVSAAQTTRKPTHVWSADDTLPYPLKLLFGGDYVSGDVESLYYYGDGHYYICNGRGTSGIGMCTDYDGSRSGVDYVASAWMGKALHPFFIYVNVYIYVWNFDESSWDLIDWYRYYTGLSAITTWSIYSGALGSDYFEQDGSDIQAYSFIVLTFSTYYTCEVRGDYNSYTFWY